MCNKGVLNGLFYEYLPLGAHWYDGMQLPEVVLIRNIYLEIIDAEIAKSVFQVVGNI